MVYFCQGYDSITWWFPKKIKRYYRSPLPSHPHAYSDWYLVLYSVHLCTHWTRLVPGPVHWPAIHTLNQTGTWSSILVSVWSLTMSDVLVVTGIL